MVASVSESSLCPCAWHRPLQELLLGVEEDVLVAGDDLHPLPQLPPQWLTAVHCGSRPQTSGNQPAGKDDKVCCVGPWHLIVCSLACLSHGRGHGQSHRSLTLHGRGRCRACRRHLALACLLLAPHQLVQHLATAPCISCTALCMYSLVFCNCQCLLLHKPCTVGRHMVQPMGFCKQLISLAFLLAQLLYISTLCSQLLVLQSSNYDLNGVSRIFSSQARYFVLRSSGSKFVGVVNMVGLL